MNNLFDTFKFRQKKLPFAKMEKKLEHKCSINFRYKKQFRRINTFRSNYLSVKIQKKKIV